MSYDSDSSEVVISDESGSEFSVPVPKRKKKEGVPKATAKTKSPKKPAKTKKKADKGNEKLEVVHDGDDPLHIFESIDHATEGGKKKLSIERIYQKKSQLEHILLRPDTYIGSVEFTELTPSWVYDCEKEKLVYRDIKYVPGLYKIFDEVLVNAADNKQRDKTMNTIKINIDREKNEISVWNNGKGIPVVEHQVEKVFVPELIFGTLLTSSNYDDSERKVTGGRNGFGAKLCNIFSKKFTVETSCKEYKRAYKQSWTNNMQKSSQAKVTDSKGDDYTKVTFEPDLDKFGMTRLEEDVVALLSRRALDVAGSAQGLRVFLNGKRLPVSGFKQYVEQYVNDKKDDNGDPLKVAFETVNKRWEVAVTVSDRGFQQVSFVNSIATTKGGRHVDYVADQITSKLIDTIKKKVTKNGINIKPFQIKSHMWIFVNALIENPTFDSQTKENMTLQAKSFGSKCDLSEKFVSQVTKCGLVESIMAWVRFKQQDNLDKKCSGKKSSKLKGVQKLEDANDAGTRQSGLCTLILTEGDSAKTLAVSGLAVVGRDKYGVFPLKGKMLNVREASHKQLMENMETNNLIKILGLQYKKKYDNDDEFKTLRYGKVMIMADQDQDGSHIKGLLINFIHYNWPSLIRRNFVEQFITPIVKATKGKEELSFFSMPEYVEWKSTTQNWNKYKIKYYKGLGTSTSKEAKEYFSDMARHQIRFRYRGQDDDTALELAFSKKKIEERKNWLTDFMNERKRRRANKEAEDYLYNKETTTVSFAEFVNKELVLFSNTDNERSIPSLVDGLKPGQRKVLFTCFKRADKKEVKVAQLAGAVGEMSAYHHGEASLMSTIINLAQDFVGSNNINLLLPKGQFGTRLQGGKDSASPRYIFTMLNPVTRALFPAEDDNVLRFLFEDNQHIEPEWYCPIIPTVLVNGAAGIGTGWSTNVPNYDPREIVDNIRRMIKGEMAQTMNPWFKNFKGTIERLDNTRFVCSGEVSVIDDNTIEITELPVRKWTQDYKENTLEPLLGTDKLPAMISDFKDYTTDATVKFLVTMPPQKLRDFEHQGFHKIFKLQSTINTTSMVLFDADGCLRRFERVEDIMADFFDTRKRKYMDRKKFLEGMLQAQSRRLSNQARFILEKIEGKIVIENKKKRVIVDRLIELKYDPDPVKIWKAEQKKKEMEAMEEVTEEEEMSGDEEGDKVSGDVDQKLSDFDYLVSMAIMKLSMEEKDKMIKESEDKKHEYHSLQAKTWADLWNDDLDKFIVELDKQEEKERLDRESVLLNQGKVNAKKVIKAGGGRVKKAGTLAEVKPSPLGIRVAPIIDPALKARAEKADQAKENKGGRQKQKRKLDPEDDVDTATLLERVLKKSPELVKKQKDLTDGAKQQSIAKFLGPADKTKKKEVVEKKKKRKVEWDSDESDESEEDEEDISVVSFGSSGDNKGDSDFEEL